MGTSAAERYQTSSLTAFFLRKSSRRSARGGLTEAINHDEGTSTERFHSRQTISQRAGTSSGKETTSERFPESFSLPHLRRLFPRSATIRRGLEPTISGSPGIRLDMIGVAPRVSGGHQPSGDSGATASNSAS